MTARCEVAAKRGQTAVVLAAFEAVPNHSQNGHNRSSQRWRGPGLIFWALDSTLAPVFRSKVHLVQGGAYGPRTLNRQRQQRQLQSFTRL